MSGEIRLLIWTEPWNSSSLFKVVLEELVCKFGSGFKNQSIGDSRWK